jgi:hypothetical protein
MIEQAAPIWMVLSVAFGFIVGDAFGDSIRHRKCLEQANADLRHQSEKARARDDLLEQELKQQRDAINDIHRYLLPVSKGPGKATN